jgi:glucosamine--fructose-6-phosphate aminotransferase (isomerizing)
MARSTAAAPRASSAISSPPRSSRARLTGIGPTRGHPRPPNEINAHPHATDKVAWCTTASSRISRSLRDELGRRPQVHHRDRTETGRHLLTDLSTKGKTPEQAMAPMCRLHGAFSLAILFADRPE